MATSRQETFSGTKEVSENLAIDAARLEAYLARHIAGFSGPLTIRQFKGGQSNPTYLLETPSRKYVLRRKPPGKLLPSAHAVDREYRVMKALGPTPVPVPQALHLCEDESIAGTMFYVMSFAEGRIFWEPLMPASSGEERAAVYDSMNAAIAALHTVDPAAVGLADFGKPGNYFERQIGRWSKQYKASETDPLPEMDRLIDWLPGALPDEARTEETCIVHGDYRIDNVVFAKDSAEALAILDWELSTLGHPLADFTYHLMLWRLPAEGAFPGMAGADLTALGIPTEAEYAEAYCARTKRPMIRNMDYFMAYNAFRIAAILQGIAGRVRDGTATSDAAKQTVKGIPGLAKLAWEFARAAGAK
ncbi:phosphotransferase family protein [Futiania mangrovi]|uniref:Phosphotransferase family protein n=1 Tax=Futiania mangrovi TaxID=2959716 RepID=A0A9J6PNI8_9PROT|nr:phosphotransferase family protein [Futiania mangrovii]MCP1337634.1 phosphotransferase family protein [Futiania mangrovii]